MTELQNQVHTIQERLAIGDKHVQKYVCNDALALLGTLTDSEQRASLCSLIVMPLLGQGRLDEWHKCLDILYSSPICRFQMIAVETEVEWYRKKNDADGMQRVYNKGIELATKLKDNDAISRCYLGKGKTSIIQNQPDAALASLGNCIEFAKLDFDFNLVAAATYYMAIVMHMMQRPAIALDKLREAADIAVAHHNPLITQMTEMLRAKWMYEQGEMAIVETIFKDWINNFALTL